MSGTSPPIFRPTAVRHYAESQTETVTPRFVSPRIFLVLWLLFASLLAGTLSAWLVRVPVYDSTVAIVVRVATLQTTPGTVWHQGPRPDRRKSGGVVLAILVPPNEIGRLRVGQALLLGAAAQGVSDPASQPLASPRSFSPAKAQGRMERPIIALDRTVRSPDALRQRFGLRSTTALAVTQPAAVAWARLEPVPDGVPASFYLGSIYQAEVEIGFTRILALVPVVGGLFGE